MTIFEENILTVAWIVIWHIYWLSESCYPPMLFLRRWKIFIDCLTTLKVPPNMLPEKIEFKPPWKFLVAVLFTLWLCCVFQFHWSELYRSSQNWRQDLFQKWKLYNRQMRTSSWLLSTSGVIQILMRVIRLTNGKPCRYYYTCGHTIFMTWVISLNNLTVMW